MTLNTGLDISFDNMYNCKAKQVKKAEGNSTYLIYQMMRLLVEFLWGLPSRQEDACVSLTELIIMILFGPPL
jgi:hypothetical protein